VPRYRTVFVSDIHIGAWGAKVKAATDFLSYNDFDELHLVGDVFDFWALLRKLHWPEENNTFVQKVLRKARWGTQVYYEPGNHDESVKRFDGFDFGNIHVRVKHIHTTASGKKYLIIHGDQFDAVVTRAKWLSKAGAVAYDKLLWINHWITIVRGWLGLPAWSFSKFLKHKVKEAVRYMNDYEEALAQVARDNGCTGIICGHIHHPEDRMIGDIHYLNTGDWVESSSAVVEHGDGRLELLKGL
jgi:UDP-2,3-diacylglucosamine pyrophosphatase LpxH